LDGKVIWDVGSGYTQWGGMPGNVLLAFGVEGANRKVWPELHLCYSKERTKGLRIDEEYRFSNGTGER